MSVGKGNEGLIWVRFLGGYVPEKFIDLLVGEKYFIADNLLFIIGGTIPITAQEALYHFELLDERV
jgi:hypothetical protein